MKDKVCFKSDTSAQILILTGFVIAVIVIGMGTVLYSVANSGQQTSILQSDRAYNNFENIREEYGIALMVSSDYGEINPFNVSNTTIILEFEDRMKTIVESHGFILNFTDHEHIQEKNRAVVKILFTDGKKEFNDIVTYNLLTGEIIYDAIPPGYIYDLHAKTPGTPTGCTGGDGLVELNWTAVGNDYYEDTKAYKYEIFYWNKSIDGPDDFNNATSYDHYYDVGRNGTPQYYIVEGLDPDLVWHFAIKVYDKAGNFNYSNNASAEASEWAPEVYNITANNDNSSFTEGDPYQPNLFANRSDNITIEFQVKDRDNDNVTISLMVRNRTFSHTGWDYGDWFVGNNWPMGNYSNMTLSYNIPTKINESWDYYFNLTDNSSCGKKRSDPSGAPYNYYWIEIPYDKYETVALEFVNDTYIISSNSSNCGNLDVIHVKKLGGTYRHGLIKFNLSSIGSLDVEFANISLYVNSTIINKPVYFYKIETSWDEYIVNDTSAITINTTSSTNCTPSSVGYMNCIISNDEINYLLNTNNGWLIKFEDNNYDVKFDSKEAANASRRPVLYVTYSDGNTYVHPYN